jgi:hypothetical protein
VKASNHVESVVILQVELLDAAKERNIIVCLGTSSSKIFIATKLIQELANAVRRLVVTCVIQSEGLTYCMFKNWTIWHFQENGPRHTGGRRRHCFFFSLHVQSVQLMVRLDLARFVQRPAAAANYLWSAFSLSINLTYLKEESQSDDPLPPRMPHTVRICF